MVGGKWGVNGGREVGGKWWGVNGGGKWWP